MCFLVPGLHKHGEPWEPGSRKARYLTGSFDALKKKISLITVESSTKRSPAQLRENENV